MKNMILELDALSQKRKEQKFVKHLMVFGGMNQRN